MPKADRVLYGALAACLRRFQHARIPLTGVIGTDIICHDLDPTVTLQRSFRNPGELGFGEGAKLIAALDQQLEVLRACDEETRQSLAEWRALAAKHAAAPRGAAPSVFAPAAALEDGLDLARAQSHRLSSPLLFEDVPLDPRADADGGEEEPPPPSLHDLAARAKAIDPELFAAAQAGGLQALADAESVQRRTAAVVEVLYRQQRLRYEPFEWVYDGLAPLWPADTLRRRKGSPIALAAVVAAVGRRAGVPLLPVPAGPVGGAGSGNSTDKHAELQGRLAPELLQRLAGKAQVSAPPPATWAVLLGGGAAAPGAAAAGAAPPLVVDPCTGRLLSGERAQQLFPGSSLDAAAWGARGALPGWRALARSLVQAHTRRGESELAAHWMRVVLALDTGAPEWAHVLGAQRL